jgi:hypothetical protein
MRDVNVRERGRRGMRVKDLERKKKKKREWRERERETYERIQGMRKKKKLRRIITSKLNFEANRFCFLLMLKSGERER